MNAPKFWKFVPALLVCGAVGMAYAKLPPPPPMTDEQKAKAEEAAEATKKARELEEKYMDRAVERYKKQKAGAALAAAQPAKKK